MKYLVLILIFVSSCSLAKLRPSSWEELIDNSQLIVYAEVREIKTTSGMVGNSKLEILNVAKGNYYSDFITVHWSGEEHDDRISQTHRRIVLFLKKNDLGNYVGASYGRSFWKAVNGENDFSINISRYPLTYVKGIPQSLSVTHVEYDCNNAPESESKRVYVRRLLKYVKETS